MSDRHSSPPATEPDDNMSVSETDLSSYEDSTSSASEDATGSKEKGSHEVKMIVKTKRPAVTSSSDSNQSTSPTCSSAVLPEVTAAPVSQRSSSSPSSSSKSTASPKRTRSERHFQVFRELRRISKERMRAKQMRRILRNFLMNYPLASLVSSQALLSASTSAATSGFPFSNFSCLRSDKATVSTLAPAAASGASAEGSKETDPKTADQFVSDRVNNLTDLLDEVESLEKFIAQRNMFDIDAPGPSSRFPTQDGESIIHRLASKLLETLKNLQNLAEGLRSWCLSERATVEELKYYMNLLNSMNLSSPDSRMVRQMFKAWEKNQGSASQLRDASCLLQVENKLRALQQSLVAESHVMYYKYWADKNKEMEDHTQKRN